MRGTGGAWEDVDDSIDSATTVQQNASGWNVASGMFDAKGNLTASGVASITPAVTTIANKSIDDKREKSYLDLWSSRISRHYSLRRSMRRRV